MNAEATYGPSPLALPTYDQVCAERESREAAADSARLLAVALARIKELESENAELKATILAANYL